jgi:glutamate synthase (ferredoxin)
MQEAWDGPALLVFSDGVSVGAALDRNGLRPARYMVTADAHGKDIYIYIYIYIEVYMYVYIYTEVYMYIYIYIYIGKETMHMMSEVGVTKALDQFNVDTSGSKNVLIQSGRLGPGEMMSVNLKNGKILLNDELKRSVASERPYEQWVASAIQPLARSSFKDDVAGYANRFVTSPEAKAAALLLTAKDPKPVANEDQRNDQSQIEMQTFFGWGIEDTEVQISAMAQDGIEATISMGDDAPLAALSVMPHVLFDYFKQRFAQVTNPPIDSLREGAVMSLVMFLGPRGDPLSPTGQPDVRVKIESPVLNMQELKELQGKTGVKMTTLTTLYSALDALTIGGLEVELDRLCEQAVAAVKDGATIINLSDLLETDEKIATGYTGTFYPHVRIVNVTRITINLVYFNPLVFIYDKYYYS